MEIVLESGARRGARFKLRDGTHSLGRDASNSWIVQGRGVSRQHAEIQVSGDSFLLRDLGSSNGTWVNGLACEASPLAWGDRILLGGVRVRVVHDGEPALPPLAPVTAQELLLGQHPSWRSAARDAVKASQNRTPLWIEGPPGSGRQGLARAIHRLSERKYGPFGLVDLGSLPEAAQSAEILGDKERMGLLPLCEKGSLVIHRVERLSTPVAQQLVEQLQRLPRVRFCGIAAPGTLAGSPLQALTPTRLSVPGLRERSSDIPNLAKHFLALQCQSARLSDACLAKLQDHAWPGNIRELREVLEACLRSAGGELIEPRHLPSLTGERAPGVLVPDAIVQGDLDAPVLPLQEVINRAVKRALLICQDDRGLTADLLHISRKDLAQHIKRFKQQSQGST